MADHQLSRNAFGRLVFTDAEGNVHDGVVPVRAFPIGAPDDGIALVNLLGQEVLWIRHLNELSGDMRALIEEELASREFMPKILRIDRVSSYATPCQWQVETDRGRTSFTLRGEEDIRRLSGATLLIADSHGIHFLVRDVMALDGPSRKILDRFL